MNSELLGTIAGGALSFIFSYMPGFRAKFEELESDLKRLVMLALLFVATIGLYFYYNGLAWNQAGVIEALEAFVWAAVINQTAFSLSPKGKLPGPQYTAAQSSNLEDLLPGQVLRLGPYPDRQQANQVLASIPNLGFEKMKRRAWGGWVVLVRLAS